MRRKLSLSPRLHHLQSMPLRARRNAPHTRGVRMCTHTHTQSDVQAGDRMVAGCRRWVGGRFCPFFFNLPGRKDCGRGAQWLETLCCFLCCQLRNIYSRLSQSLSMSPSLLLFSPAFVLADNKPGGAGKKRKKKKILQRKRILSKSKVPARTCRAELSELVKFTPRLLSLHRIRTHNTLKHNPSSLFPSSPSSFFFSPFLCFISDLDSTVF